MKKYTRIFARRLLYCEECPQCVTNERGQKVCKVKVSQKLDCVGIHVASDGTALNCPRC